MQVAWVYGAPGVGKSTAAWQLYCDLVGDGVPAAYVDIDQLGMCYPAEVEDPDRHRLKVRSLAALVPNYADAGVEHLVVSGVLDPRLVEWCRDELAAAEVKYCRLTVDQVELRRRLDERGATVQEWDSVLREVRKLDAAQFSHATVDTTGLTPQEVSAAVRARLGDRVPSPLIAPTVVDASSGMTDHQCPAPGHIIWMCGPTAVGKSTASWAVYSALLRDGIRAGYLDLRQLGFVGDPEAGADHALQAANVASLWRCFRATGATHLVLSGAVDTSEQVHLYREALPAAELTLYRLQADREELVRRVQARGRGDGPRLAGDRLISQTSEVLDATANRGWSEQQHLEVERLGDVVLDTTAATPTELAAQVLR